jgi:SOS-response transcriptional repressor LexA
MALSFLITGSFIMISMDDSLDIPSEMLDVPNIKVKLSQQLFITNTTVKHGEQETAYDDEMSSLQERINELFKDHPDKKNTALAAFANVSRSAVTDWRNGNTKNIEGENALAVAKFFGANTEWVIKGKGSKYPKVGLANTSEGPDFKGEVPLISWVRAGVWCEAIDNYAPGDGESWLKCPINHGEHAYALRVQGDSMTSPYPGQRSYPEGTIIYVDPDIPVVSGCRVIAKLPGTNEATFKEYRFDSGKHFLKPLNPQYQTIEINEETHFCGVVIGQFLPE